MYFFYRSAIFSSGTPFQKFLKISTIKTFNWTILEYREFYFNFKVRLSCLITSYHGLQIYKKN